MGLFGSRKKDKDPVCGMDVTPASASATTIYDEQTYYFCSKTCQLKFNATPHAFAVATFRRQG